MLCHFILLTPHDHIFRNWKTFQRLGELQDLFTHWPGQWSRALPFSEDPGPILMHFSCLSLTQCIVSSIWLPSNSIPVLLICMDLTMWPPNRKFIFSTVHTSFLCREVPAPISTVENIFCAQLLSPSCTKTLSIMENHSSLISHDAWHLSPSTNHPG